MKVGKTISTGALLSLLAISVRAEPDQVSSASTLFGAVVDATCDENTFRDESAAPLAAWAAKFAATTLVGFATSFVERAAEEQTVTRSATAPGHLYQWSTTQNRWAPYGGCIRFWYGARANVPAQAATDIYSPDSALQEAARSKLAATYGVGSAGEENAYRAIAARWAQLGFLEQPHLYGEVRLATRGSDSAIVLQPVVLFVRKPAEGRGLFRQVSKMAVAIDVKPLSSDGVIATHKIELPDVRNAAVLIRGLQGTSGLASAWAALPAAPTEPAKPRENTRIPFTALVTFTTTTDGTLFGKAVADSFKGQKEELATALTPSTKAQRQADHEKAIGEAFDAVAKVLEAEKALNEGSDADKPELAVKLQKEKYLANLKFATAGLPPRYDVAGP